MSLGKTELKEIIACCDDNEKTIRSWKDFHLKRKVILSSLSIFPLMTPIYFLGAVLTLIPSDYESGDEFQFNIYSLKRDERRIYDDKTRRKEYNGIYDHSRNMVINGEALSLSWLTNSLLSWRAEGNRKFGSFWEHKISPKQILGLRVLCFSVAAISIYRSYANAYFFDRNDRLRTKAEDLLNE